MAEQAAAMFVPVLRALYYALPAATRHLARRLYYLPKDLLAPLPGLSPPRGLIYTGGDGETFVETGRGLRELLLELDVLRADSRVLDVGSGIGRLAIPLTAVLTTGEYEGFDVVASGVAWCRRHVTRDHPQFRFTWVDLGNDLYRAAGGDASTFVFPYTSGRFTLAVATSVFSHMLPAEVSRYLAETARVLAPGGAFVFTGFVLDEASRAAMQAHDGLTFAHLHGHYSLLNERVRAANVAYERPWIEAQIAAAGLTIERQFRGRWSGLPGEHAMAFQDIYVLGKPSAQPELQ